MVWIFLGVLFCLSCKDDTGGGLTPPVVTPETPPNILLIIADDFGLDAMPGYDVAAVKPHLPHLSALAANGITYDNVWTNPICAPTRSSILTGKYGVRTGVLNVDTDGTISSTEKTLHRYLDEQTGSAYAHSIIGKWHLSNNEPTRPTDMGIGYYAGLLGGGVGDYNSWNLTENGATDSYSGYITSKFTDLSIDWINQQEKPWFCWLAYTTPHTPFHLPPSGTHSQGDLATDEASINANPLPYYMAMCENMDYEIGRLMDNIPADELEHTIILFIGDNGTPGQVAQSPYVSNRSKGSLHQGGVHVPMLVSGKGVTRQGAREASLVTSTDLFSTIAGLAGANADTYEDSFSFEHTFTTASTGMRSYSYTEILSDIANKSGYTIRNEQYKLIKLDSGVERMYDLLNDPFESNNLISGTLSNQEETAYQALLDKMIEIRE